MTPTDVAAWVGAITGSLVLLWDVFKWVHSGARVRVSAAPNMRAYGRAVALLGTKTCIAVEASNVGQAKTTITHVVGFHYTSPVHKFLQRKPLKSIIVPDPKPGAVPHALDVGERWLGMMEQNEEIEELSRNGALYVGVYGNEHRLVNETSETVVYLEVEDRSPRDEGLYPEIFISTKNFIGNVNFQPRSNAHELHD